jgi:RNA-directed DNA polymerase
LLVDVESNEPRSEGQGRNAEMNDREKSDGCVVPEKSPNEEEAMEGRRPTKRNLEQPNAVRTQSRAAASKGLDRVREAARRDEGAKFTALLHHLTPERLKASYGTLKRNAAPGVDGVRWAEYGEKLERNITDLHGRIHRGAYRAQPSRRTYIPKSDGKQRPLGIATIEDKIVQAATVEVLNAIYEEEFFGFCHGFRPQRGPHDALDALATVIEKRKVNWILDADIKRFFDNVDHGWMQKMIEHRIGDRRMVRLIMKWVKAGVMEEGKWQASEQGTPQGAVISPLLANVYLYHVFDQWAHAWRKRWARGEVAIVRYADDFIVGFQYREDAERFHEELRKRLAKFALELHPEKTRIIEFGRYAGERRSRRGEGRPETFKFLGFEHICAERQDGRFKLRRKTDPRRMTRKLAELKTELARRRHEPIPKQGLWLRSVITGHDQYYAVPDNLPALRAFRRALERMWWHSLRRRSQRSRVDRKRQQRLRERWFPTARILHPRPTVRYAATLRRSRMR